MLKIKTVPAALRNVNLISAVSCLNDCYFYSQPDEDEEEFRYVPDLMLLEMQSQIEELDKAKEDRRKK